jgi:hypothetical protein
LINRSYRSLTTMVTDEGKIGVPASSAVDRQIRLIKDRSRTLQTIQTPTTTRPFQIAPTQLRKN